MPLYYHETVFIMDKEIESDYLSHIVPKARKWFKELKSDDGGYGNMPMARMEKEGASLWYCPDMDYFLPESAQKNAIQKLKKYPPEKWLILDSMTREALPVKVLGNFLDHPFEIFMEYELNYNLLPVDDDDGNPLVELNKKDCHDIACVAFEMSWGKETADFVEKKLPKELKRLLKEKEYCNFTVTEEYDWKVEHLGKQMRILFNVPYGDGTRGDELESWLKKNIPEDDISLTILPQRVPLNYWGGGYYFLPGKTGRPPLDHAVYYGNYGPWHLKKDPFVFTAFHYLNVDNPDNEAGWSYPHEMLA